MTEPDEALLWARERAKGRMFSPNSKYRTIARRMEVDAGKHDDELSDEAQAYRAGAAASEARIKALEEALQRLVTASDFVEEYTHEIGVELEEAIEAAESVLKEADQ
jgi:hypothetical protein